MKLVLFLSLIFLGCNSADDADNQDNFSIGKKFFVYDSIDHYYNNYDGRKLNELYDSHSKSALDSLKAGIIMGGIPNDISDLYFIDRLDSIGFAKRVIDKSKFPGIDKIFTEKEVSEMLATSCVPVFRDILVFKKDNNIVGIAKICIGCMKNEIFGAKVNTDYFGQNGDYEKLEKILRN